MLENPEKNIYNSLEEAKLDNVYLLDKVKKANKLSAVSLAVAVASIILSLIIPGPQGPIGFQGPQGIQGEMGLPGEDANIDCEPVRVLTNVSLYSDWLLPQSTTIYSCKVDTRW